MSSWPRQKLAGWKRLEPKLSVSSQKSELRSCLPHFQHLEFVDRTKESVNEFDGAFLISLIRSETNLDESPLFGGLELAKTVIDEVAEEFKSHSSPPVGENSDDILPQQQEIQNENNGA